MTAAPIWLFLSCRSYAYGPCEWFDVWALMFVLPVGILGLIVAWLLLRRSPAARWGTIVASLALILLTIVFTGFSTGILDPGGPLLLWILRLIAAYGVGIALFGMRHTRRLDSPPATGLR